MYLNSINSPDVAFEPIFCVTEQLPEEMIFNIFFQCALYGCEYKDKIVLISRKWNQVFADAKLWLSLCYNAGISIPFNANQACKSYLYATTNDLKNKITSCLEPKIETIEIDLNFYNGHVHFVQDQYLIFQETHKITFFNIEEQKVGDSIVFEQEIYALCANQASLFLFLNDRTIYTCTLRAPTEQFCTIKTHAAEDITDQAFRRNATLLANEHWLISSTGKFMQKLDLKTGVPIYCTCNEFKELRLIENNLFACLKDAVTKDIYVLDLNQQELNFEFAKKVPKVGLGIHTEGFSYIEHVQHVDKCTSWIVHEAKDSTEKHYTKILKEGALTPFYLKFFKGFAIAVSGPADYLDDGAVDYNPDVIDFLDLANGQVIHSIQEHSIFSHRWKYALSFFQDTLLYVADEGQLIKITFPQEVVTMPQKRKANLLNEGETKKRKFS